LTAIPRHKAAIRRVGPSRPLRLALDSGLLPPGTTVHDQGCGHGDDLRALTDLGYAATGWDPHFCPDGPQAPADVVLLSYVLNVIERPAERDLALAAALALANQALVVSALITVDGRGAVGQPYEDGLLTRIGIFQRYFDHGELRNLLEQRSGLPAIALGPGVFALVRDEALRARLLVRRFAGPRPTLHPQSAAARWEELRPHLEPALAFFADHGRWPESDESPEIAAGYARAGGRPAAQRLLQGALPEEAQRGAITARRRALLRLGALAALGVAPPLPDSPTLRRDLRVHFGGANGLTLASAALLARLGSASARQEAARRATVGKRLPEALYVHISAVSTLPDELLLMEAAARSLVGEAEGATLVKIGLGEPAVSFLSYPHFDSDPHPALHRSLRVDLQTFRLQVLDYAQSQNPPILHRKEEMVGPDHPRRETFARLTAQEERWQLYDGSTGAIGTRQGWERRLEAAGVRLQGHRLLVGRC
jgi:DNA phosphorothioation-associated putative methyltransferase